MSLLEYFMSDITFELQIQFGFHICMKERTVGKNLENREILAGIHTKRVDLFSMQCIHKNIFLVYKYAYILVDKLLCCHNHHIILPKIWIEKHQEWICLPIEFLANPCLWDQNMHRFLRLVPIFMEEQQREGGNGDWAHCNSEWVDDRHMCLMMVMIIIVVDMASSYHYHHEDHHDHIIMHIQVHIISSSSFCSTCQTGTYICERYKNVKVSRSKTKCFILGPRKSQNF